MTEPPNGTTKTMGQTCEQAERVTTMQGEHLAIDSSYGRRRRLYCASPAGAIPEPLISSPFTCNSPVTRPSAVRKRNTSPLTVPSMGRVPGSMEKLIVSCPVTLAPPCWSVSWMPPGPYAPTLVKVPSHAPVTSTVTSVCSIQSGRAHPATVSARTPIASHAIIVSRASLCFVSPRMGPPAVGCPSRYRAMKEPTNGTTNSMGRACFGLKNGWRLVIGGLTAADEQSPSPDHTSLRLGQSSRLRSLAVRRLPLSFGRESETCHQLRSLRWAH